MTTTALLLAAGVGRRVQSTVHKAFLDIGGRSMLDSCLDVFSSCDAVDHIVVIAREEDFEAVRAACADHEKFADVVKGGERRQSSVHNGLLSIEGKADDIIVIHNAANPHIDPGTIAAVVEAAAKYEAALAAHPCRDTIKEVDAKGFVTKTLPREGLWQAQTPQAIRLGTALRAFKQAADDEIAATDDVSLVERLGKKVKVVTSPPENIKLTYPGDIALSRALLTGGRIGLGMDSHRFETDGEKTLMLGGVAIEGMQGFHANSDGDVILHALFNALSSALSDASLGHYADPLCEQGVTDSAAYLEIMTEKMRTRGYRVGNVGLMVEGDKPRLAEHEGRIIDRLCELLGTEKERISLIATSGEALTPFGRGEGMQCWCVVSLKKNDPETKTAPHA